MQHMQPPLTFLIDTAAVYEKLNTEAVNIETPPNPHFLRRVIEDFFPVFNQLVNDGSYDILYRYSDFKELLVMFIVSDMEGMGPVPMEFTHHEINLIEETVEWLLTTLLSTVESDCFCQGVNLTLLRYVGHDMLLRYDHPHCLFKVADYEQRRQLRFHSQFQL